MDAWDIAGCAFLFSCSLAFPLSSCSPSRTLSFSPILSWVYKEKRLPLTVRQIAQSSCTSEQKISYSKRTTAYDHMQCANLLRPSDMNFEWWQIRWRCNNIHFLGIYSVFLSLWWLPTIATEKKMCTVSYEHIKYSKQLSAVMACTSTMFLHSSTFDM